MPYTAQFFAEKLNVPVEYFNPLRNVQIDPTINLEDLARVAHSMGEVVGLGLRNLAHCPVELNLMPESTLKWQAFNQKKPYFVATVFSLAAGVVAMGFLFDKLAAVKQEELAKIQPQLEEQQRKSDQFKKAYGDMKKTQLEVDKLVSYMGDRYYWPDIFSELRSILIRAEETTKIKLRTDTGIWIEKLSAPSEAELGLAAEGAPGAAPGYPPPPGPINKFEGEMQRYRPMPEMQQPAAAAAPKPGGDQVTTMSITLRGISRTAVQAEANKQTAYQVLDEMRNSPYFDPTNTAISTEISPDEAPGTFWFGITNTLKQPLKL